MDESLNLIVASAFGLEAVVKRELANLGYAASGESPGRVRFAADPAAISRTNLWLRTADRVLVEVANFEARDFEALFETTRTVAWDRWLARDAAFPVNGKSRGSQLSSVPACQRAVKKAIVESLQASYGVEQLPETGAQSTIEVALLNDRVSLTIDTTGPSLHKRGYRAKASGAPLKETLAAAMVLLSFWDAERPLWDPFCGSGTIPIEAALIGQNRAPGIQRTFAAEKWPMLPSSLWKDAREEAMVAGERQMAEPLLGTDIDPRAIRAARINAERAGVAEQLHFQERDFSELSSKRRYGCLITNPPYGERLGARGRWEPLYASMPVILRRLPTWSHFILTSVRDLESLVQRKADRRRKLYNGRIECTLYQFHGPRPGDGAPERIGRSDVAGVAPVFGGITNKGREQAELFARRLQKRSRHLRRWPTKRQITCYRLYDRDIPEIPLVVDRYEDHLHISEYERPHDRDAGQHADWLDLMARTASESLQVERSKVFLKSRRRQRGKTQHERQADRRYEITVSEGGLKFLVNLSDYIDTGLFLDHRITRNMVRDMAAGRRFLNLFGYTGAFTVYAAAGGAMETTTVDHSPTYLDWAWRNMELNGFAQSCHRLERNDATLFLEALPVGEQFDLAVVDPPTFSNRTGAAAFWDVQRDHAALLNGLLLRMALGGTVFFSTNSRRFRLDRDAIRGARIYEISRQTLPDDFRNRRIHRCWRLDRTEADS